MNWVTLSLCSALAFSAYTVLQKYAFQRHLSNIFAFGFWGAVFHLVPSLAVLALHPPIWAAFPVAVTLAAGLVHATYTLLIYRVVQREEEVSRVVPVVDTYPVFVALLAVLFLGEVLTPLKWLAIGLVMSGAFLASWHQALPGSRLKLGCSFVLLLISSFGIAVYSVITKYALEYLSYWQVYALTSLSAAPAFALAALHFRAWPQVRQVGQQPSTLAVVGAAHGMLFLAFIAGFMAFSQGPVSLASAIMASRPLIVLAYATLLSIFLRRVLAERTTLGALMAKGLAAALVTAGVGAIALS